MTRRVTRRVLPQEARSGTTVAVMASRNNRRLHIPTAIYPPLALGALPLNTEDSHYVLNVLRLQPGDAVALFDGTGATAESVLIPGPSGKRKAAVLNLVAIGTAPAPTHRVSVALPPPKGERTDWLVEKLTEIGVHAVHWLHTAYSEDQAARLRPQRLDRLMGAAARQAGIDRLPVQHAPQTLEAFLQGLPQSGARFVAHPRASHLLTYATKSLAADITVVIGPEGGLAPAEVALLEGNGFIPVGLSAHILRVETAALVAAATLTMMHE